MHSTRCGGKHRISFFIQLTYSYTLEREFKERIYVNIATVSASRKVTFSKTCIEQNDFSQTH